MKKKSNHYQRRDEPLPQEWAQEPGLLSNCNLHTVRCDADPMYHMLLFGDALLTLDNGVQMRFIDVLIKSAKQAMDLKYGKYFSESRWIKQMFHLLEDQHDLAIKIFVMNFILKQETTIARTFSEMYNTQEEAALFPGNRGPQQLMLYIRYYLNTIIEAHFNHANNKYTIVQEIEQHVQRSINEYIMGPFEAPAKKN
jgi:hypothetical protein